MATTADVPAGSGRGAGGSGDEARPVRLRCLSGGAMPDDLNRDAQRIDKLTDGALAALSRVLRVCVVEPMSAELGQELSRLCVHHEVAEADLGRVLRAVRWLLREASAADASAAAIEADVHAIWRDPRGLAAAVTSQYEGIKQDLRRQLLQDALTSHGNVLVDVDWRVDVVAADRHAPKLMSPVALVTLRYRGAEKGDRLTLQILPDQLARLAQVFGALAQRTLKPVPDDDEG
jgi:hypothetical protein